MGAAAGFKRDGRVDSFAWSDGVTAWPWVCMVCGAGQVPDSTLYEMVAAIGGYPPLLVCEGCRVRCLGTRFRGRAWQALCELAAAVALDHLVVMDNSS